MNISSIGSLFRLNMEDGILKTMAKVSMIALLFIVAIVVLMDSWFRVEEYQRGVVTTLGKYSYTADPGPGLKVPFIQRVTYFRTDVRDLQPNKAVNTYTSDNQEVDILFTVFYIIPPDKVEFVYQNVQDYHMRLFSIANDRLKAEMGKVNVAHFAENRANIREKIKAIVQRDALDLGLKVTDFQISDIIYTPSFRTAVEKAAAAKAGVETKENERLQAEKQAATDKIKAEGEANAMREAAKGEADSKLFVAQATAKAIQLEGEARAKAMHAQADALSRNPVLVEQTKAEKWDGKLPSAIYAGAPIPFMSVPTGAK